MKRFTTLHAFASWPELNAAAIEWRDKTGASLISPELPLLGAYMVVENLALVRQVHIGNASWRAWPLARVTLERAGLGHLAKRRAETLDAGDVLAVKCLAAAMHPGGKVAVVCGGHLIDATEEMRTIARMIGMFADRWLCCDVFLEESRAAFFANL